MVGNRTLTRLDAGRKQWVIWVVARRKAGHRARLLTGSVGVVVLVVAADPHLGRVALVAAERGTV